MMETKLSIITVSLVLLTFTVIIYDIHAFNLPRVLYIEVWRHGEYEEIPESWETVVTITGHPLKEKIIRYVNMSWLSRGEHVYIVNDPKVEEFFGKYHVSTWCLTCTLAMSPYLIDGDSYYHVLVGYGVAPYLDRRLAVFLDYRLAWSFSIAIVILWILRASSIRKLKSEKRTEIEKP